MIFAPSMQTAITKELQRACLAMHTAGALEATLCAPSERAGVDGARHACFICGAEDHISRMCPTRRRPKAESTDEKDKESEPPPKRQKPETAQEEESDDEDNELDDPDDFYASVWDDYSGGMHDDDAPEGAFQTCYWTDGTLIERTKVNGEWKYRSTPE